MNIQGFHGKNMFLIYFNNNNIFMFFFLYVDQSFWKCYWKITILEFHQTLMEVCLYVLPGYDDG